MEFVGENTEKNIELSLPKKTEPPPMTEDSDWEIRVVGETPTTKQESPSSSFPFQQRRDNLLSDEKRLNL